MVVINCLSFASVNAVYKCIGSFGVCAIEGVSLAHLRNLT